jgi:hypothetical protein
MFSAMTVEDGARNRHSNKNAVHNPQGGAQQCQSKVIENLNGRQ